MSTEMIAKPQKEHQLLEKLVGEWTYESEGVMGDGQPPMKSQGTEKVRSLGGIWIVCEGEMQMPDGQPGTTIMTLGFNPSTKRYVGSWIGSMMTHMWVYNGEMDAENKVLTLNTEGPDMSGKQDKVVQYQDIIEFVSDDHRILRSQMKGDDGKWHQFMTAHYRRKK